MDPNGKAAESYALAMRALVVERVPFLVGGTLALTAFCGIRRPTKDLDLFVEERSVPDVLDVLAGAGFRTERPFEHWLSKAYAGEHFIDIIHNAGNGQAPVDHEWFGYAIDANVLGIQVKVCPAEETIWSKAFVMERERFDGADVAHLLLSCAGSLDWPRLLRRFGSHAPVLYAHLVLFGYVFPAEAERIPRWVMEDLSARAAADLRTPKAERLCRGTMLSRAQYLTDITSGWKDARLQPAGTMSSEAIARWTAAIQSSAQQRKPVE